MPHDVEPTEALTISGLRAFIALHPIEETYDYLGHDYAAAAQGKAPPPRFIRNMNWTVAPSNTETLRFFNQLNTWYAERWALNNVFASPTVVLMECNRLLLYREGKRVGFRDREISFGSREFLDFMDPRRQFKRLVGTAPSLLADALRVWSDTVSTAPQTDAAVIALCAALLAIHPFSDANGRLGRVLYSWMRRRFGLIEQWIAENDEGECLITGTGIDSTEYLLGALQLRFARHHNAFPYGGGVLARESSSDAHNMLLAELRILDGEHGILSSPEFVELYQHLRSYGHFQQQSPRFACLRDFLAP